MKSRKPAGQVPADEVTLNQAQRQRAVADAVHSNEMEGLSVSAEFDADAAEYVSGNITFGEFGRRVRVRNILE